MQSFIVFNCNSLLARAILQLLIGDCPHTIIFFIPSQYQLYDSLIFKDCWLREWRRTHLLGMRAIFRLQLRAMNK
ncbi:hypothetical protein VNO78_10242 [Psophocarpus tetragonolobus]|uniref:Uncharacterized protein n=1 Tax=Psophocarpus tetragonolobus TaxID=3891 RepID=A0AAN9XMS7_PSOTE